MEKFLAFWSHNNAVIIEVLVALILFSTIYLVYRTFFGSKAAEPAEGPSGFAVNTVQIEKTLQKILEQQANSSAGGSARNSDAFSGGEESLALVAELATVKKALEEKEKQVLVLQEKAAAATKAAQEANPASPSADAIAAAAQAAAGLAEKERSDYEAKIKELESRLAEYEIISEDIADLSFFKEENARLSKELEELRAGGATVSAEPVPESKPEPQQAAPENVSEATEAVDDSLLAEFAQAVEGQKTGTENVAAKKDDNDQLLAEFENFNKKS